MLLSSAQNSELDRLLNLLHTHAVQAGYGGSAWLNPHYIARFVAENPAELDADSLERIGLWRHALPGPFFVLRHTETCSMFMNRLGTFAVRGSRVELKKLVPQTPTQVNATLLPFDGLIVCAEDPSFLPDQLGEANQANIDSTYRNLADKGVIYSAAAMIRAVKQGNNKTNSSMMSLSHTSKSTTHPLETDSEPTDHVILEQATEAFALPHNKETIDVPQGLAQIIAFKPRPSSDAALS